jgi:hypothetical protein
LKQERLPTGETERAPEEDEKGCLSTGFTNHTNTSWPRSTNTPLAGKGGVWANLAADDDVVARGVDSEAGNAGTSQQLLGKGLLGQVVDAHVVLRGHEEEGLGRVKRRSHHAAAVLAERVLRRLLGQLMHQHRLRGNPPRFTLCLNRHTGLTGTMRWMWSCTALSSHATSYRGQGH